jgi:DMSO reductase anchor subunit
MAIAPLHLGQPLRAWRIFLGLRTSWLSREAVLLGKYMALLAATTCVLGWQQFTEQPLPFSLPAWLPQLCSGLTIVLGIAGLHSSAMIYIATKRKLWRFSRTMLRFFGTSAVIGTMVASAIEGSFAFAVIGSVIAAIKLFWEWRTQLHSGATDKCEYDRRSRRLVRQSLAQLRNVRVLSAGLAIAFAACGALSLLIGPAFLGSVLLTGASALLLVGECCERLLYFSSVVFDRMPGALI